VSTSEAPPPSEATASGRYGPLVHRSVHHGAIVLIVASIQFILGMAITQVGYGSSYSLSQNYISDLGATHCGIQGGGGPFGGMGRYICSPWHDVFNVSCVILGLLVILGAILIRSAFPARRSRTIGLALLAVAGIGAIGVGLFPEDVQIDFHVTSALLAFVGGNLALVVLGFAMFRDTRWDGFRAYSVLSGLIGLVAVGLFASKTYLFLGVGGMERLVAAPVILWAIVVGIHLARIPTFAPRIIPRAPAT